MDSELEGSIWEVERPRRVLARDGEGEGQGMDSQEKRSWAVPWAHHLKKNIINRVRPDSTYRDCSVSGVREPGRLLRAKEAAG